MSWAAGAVGALEDAFQGWGEGPVLAVAALGPDGQARSDVEDGLLFEIGSITKTLTATVLASAALRGEVVLDDPVGRWLDAGTNGHVTLLALATHTSGLPRLAPNHSSGEGFDRDDPYAAYTAELAEAGLREAVLATAGTETLYSNFGFQLLGLALERATGERLASLFRDRVLSPLGMVTAGVEPPAGTRVVQGHGADGPVVPWRIPLPGPGGVLATLDDMARYLDALLAPPDGEVGEVLRATIDLHASEGDPHRGRAWGRQPDGITWHNGGTAGCSSMLAFDRGSGRGIVALASTGEAEDIGVAVLAVLRGTTPEPVSPKVAGPEWAERALAVVDDLAGARWEEVHERMAGPLRELAGPATLSEVWSGVVATRGGHRSSEVVRARRVGRGVSAELEVHFEQGEAKVAVAFDEDGHLVGLRIT